MEFILTQNLKNLLNSFNDNYIYEPPTSVSNTYADNHGHNLITMGPVSKDATHPNIFTCDNTKEGVIAFNTATQEGIKDSNCYYVYNGNFVTKYSTSLSSSGDSGSNPISTLLNAGCLLNLEFTDKFTTWTSDSVPPSYSSEVIHGLQYQTTASGCTIFFCEDLTFDATTNSPTGKFKSVQLQTSSVNKSTVTYTIIDPYDGEITAKTMMIGVNLQPNLYQSAKFFDPVIIGGAVLDNPILLDRGASITFQIDWGISNLA